MTKKIYDVTFNNRGTKREPFKAKNSTPLSKKQEERCDVRRRLEDRLYAKEHGLDIDDFT